MLKLQKNYQNAGDPNLLPKHGLGLATGETEDRSPNDAGKD
jgi:hypothetical protein